jgi:hypothetical protein
MMHDQKIDMHAVQGRVERERVESKRERQSRKRNRVDREIQREDV